MRFAFIFVSPQLLLDQLARTRGAAGNSATPFLCHRLCLSFRQSLPLFPSFYLLPSLLPSSLSSTLPIQARLAIVAGPAISPIPCSHLYTLSLSRPGLSLWQVPPGLLPLSPTSLPLSFPTSYIGTSRSIPSPSLCPAGHCDRSRLASPLLISLPIRITLISITPLTIIYPSYIISLGPACHCGRSRPFLPLSCTFPLFIPLLSPSLCYTPPFLRYTVARLVIVAGPAIPFYSCTFLTPLPLPFLLSTSVYRPPPLHLQSTGPACHCGWSRPSHIPVLPPSSSLLIPKPPLIHAPPLLPSPPSHPGPAYHCGRSRPS